MQRDVLLLEEMIEAAEQIRVLTGDLPAVADLEADRLRRDALLWNFTVLGEAASQLSDRTRNEFPRWRGTGRRCCGTGLCTDIGLSTSAS